MSHLKLEFYHGKSIRVSCLKGHVGHFLALHELRYEEVDALSKNAYDAYVKTVRHFYKEHWPSMEPKIPIQMSKQARAAQKQALDATIDEIMKMVQVQIDQLVPMDQRVKVYKEERERLMRMYDPNNPKWAYIEKKEKMVKLQALNIFSLHLIAKA
jgi:hypothetical protein